MWRNQARVHGDRGTTVARITGKNLRVSPGPFRVKTVEGEAVLLHRLLVLPGSGRLRVNLEGYESRENRTRTPANCLRVRTTEGEVVPLYRLLALPGSERLRRHMKRHAGHLGAHE